MIYKLWRAVKRWYYRKYVDTTQAFTRACEAYQAEFDGQVDALKARRAEQIKRTRELEQKQKDAGALSCIICHKVAGLKYYDEDGVARGVTLTFHSVRQGNEMLKGYICTSCLNGGQ